MIVVVICERFGRIRDAFNKRGHLAVSCDLVPSETDNTLHIQEDCRNLNYSGVDLLIANPDCTYLCNSGVRWLYEEEGRWEKMEEAALFFRWILELPVPKIAVENPIMHKYAIEIIGKKQDQIIQPWQYGHGETKATCLWLKGLPKLQATDIVDGRHPAVHLMSPSPDRGIKRSITYQGVADAMAEQWGILA